MAEKTELIELQQYKINFYPSGRWSIHLLSDKLELGTVSYGETREDFINACIELSAIIPYTTKKGTKLG